MPSLTSRSNDDGDGDGDGDNDAALFASWGCPIDPSALLDNTPTPLPIWMSPFFISL